MKTLTVKLDDRFAAEVDQFQQDSDYGSKSELVRDALKTLMIARRKQQMQARLQRYLQDTRALTEAADDVENRMAATEEALVQSEQ